MTLSVLIPARNEMWLNRTVADVLEHSGDQTDVIVVLDGQWPSEPLPQHPRLTLVYLPTSIGQRAATNLAARLSAAEYVMKLDAHCALAPGFDAVLLETAATLPRETVQIPMQFNLHVFDWVCDQCQRRTYQGPTPTQCETCQGTAFHRDVVWRPRKGTKTTAWRFDRDLKFQYWGEFTQRPEGQGELTDTLSCLGACWCLDRAWFLALGGLDEAHGSWGQMGTELACKAWLSGGRMVCNHRTWFAHLFRTQGGDFGFPYPIRGSDQDAARAYSRRLWLEDGWPQATHPLTWLIDRFRPVPTWDDPPMPQPVSAPRSAQATIGLVYYSDCRGDPTILDACRTRLIGMGLPIVAVTLAPVPGFPRNLVLDEPRGYLTMFRQILMGLEATDAEIVFLVEHDVLYSAEHFLGRPGGRDRYCYNQHVWKVDAATGRALHYRCNQTSGLCADRQLLTNHYRARVARVAAVGYQRSMGFEPGTHRPPRGFDDYGHETWWSTVPNVDIRHGHNLTPNRWRKDQFRDQRYTAGWTESDSVPGWGRTLGRFEAFLREHAGVTHAQI